MVLPMNTGAEAVETGIKLARKWGYKEKGIPINEAIVLAVSNNFHGRTVRHASMEDTRHNSLIRYSSLRSPSPRIPSQERTTAHTCRISDPAFLGLPGI